MSTLMKHDRVKQASQKKNGRLKTTSVFGMARMEWRETYTLY